MAFLPDDFEVPKLLQTEVGTSPGKSTTRCLIASSGGSNVNHARECGHPDPHQRRRLGEDLRPAQDQER